MSRFRFLLFLAIPLMIGQGCPPTTTPDGSGGDGDGNGDGNGSTVTTVTMRNVAFNPASLEIPAGRTVRWVNQDFVPHTVTSGDPDDADAGALFDSGNIAPGGQYERTFDAPGTFTYFCRTHPLQMRGATVTVR